MNPDHGVHQQRLKIPRETVSARLARLLIHAVMRVGRKRAALPGFEIHHVIANRAAAQFQRLLARFPDHRDIHAERCIRGFGARDGLKHQIHRSAAPHGVHRCGDMRQHAALRRNSVRLAHAIQQPQQRFHARQIVRHRIDPDHRVAAAVEQSVDDAGGDALRIVGGMIGLQARGKAPGQSQRVAKPRDHANLGRHRDQILQPHDFGNGRRHLGHQPRRQRSQNFASGLFAQQPVAKIANRKVGHGRECRLDRVGRAISRVTSSDS